MQSKFRIFICMYQIKKKKQLRIMCSFVTVTYITLIRGIKVHTETVIYIYIYIYIYKPNQVKTLLPTFERAAAGIDLHVNAHKTEYMCYNQTGDISTLDETSLKLVNKFNYLGSSILPTEKGIDTRLTWVWTAIDRLSIIRKSDLTDKMKRSFFQAAVVSILLYGWTFWTLTKRLEKLDGNLHKNFASNIEQAIAATPHKPPTLRPPSSHHENYPS